LRKKIVGLDLDNTLIDYSNAVSVYANKYLKRNLKSIFEIRKTLKTRDIDSEWQKAQSWIYTEGLNYAVLSEGAIELLHDLKQTGTPLYVISHKTRRTPRNFGNLDLRKPAEEWIKLNLEPLDINISGVFFESTRTEKIERIKRLNITHFVDDLIEVLTDENFPKSVEKYLYNPSSQNMDVDPNIKVIHRLNQI
jgi:hypothetical protein